MTITAFDQGDLASGNNCIIATEAVTGGTIYVIGLREGQAGLVGITSVFVPSTVSGANRYLGLTNAKADTGIPLTATATGGAMGVSRTAGTSLVLVGEATSASAKTDKALWETQLPQSYVAGANIPVVINANYTGSGTVTGASTTLTVNAYTEVNGVETALTVSAAQQFTATGTNYTFTITGTGLVAGQDIVIEIVMLVTTSAGAATGQINSILLQA